MADPFSRRSLLKIAPAALLTACGVDGGEPVRKLSSANDWLSARLFSIDRLAPEYPASARTTDFPPYFISKQMPTLSSPSDWALNVGGLVRKPMRLTIDQLQALPRTTITVKHFCVEGWTAVATWSGVRVSALAALVEPLETARYLRFDSFDSGYANGWDLPSALHPQTILAYGHNDRELTAEHGAPLRLYASTKLGYKLTKYLSAVTFTADKPGGYWEDQGYPWFAGV